MLIKFWGTRGSIPAPGKTTVLYGGNTPCVSVELNDGTRVILDGGTGIRKLGLELLKKNTQKHLYLLITHSHWDHIQGIPFFLPIYRKDYHITVISSAETSLVLQQSLQDLLKRPYFPVSYESLPARIEYQKPENSSFKIGSAGVEIIKTRHPDNTFAYKFTENGRSFVYMTDNEISYPELDHAYFDSLVSYCKGAQVLIHDTMYTKDEYPSKLGWGHSCFEAAIELALKAGVRELIFFHYEPEYPDAMISRIVSGCAAAIKKSRHKLRCTAAREGRQFTV